MRENVVLEEAMFDAFARCRKCNRLVRIFDKPSLPGSFIGTGGAGLYSVEELYTVEKHIGCDGHLLPPVFHQIKVGGKEYTALRRAKLARNAACTKVAA